MIGFSPVRAQVFTYCFFATSVYLLERARISQRWGGLWLLVPLQVLWCNLHGGFLAGLGLMGLYALGEGLSRRPLSALSPGHAGGRAGYPGQSLWLGILALSLGRHLHAPSGDHRVGLPVGRLPEKPDRQL